MKVFLINFVLIYLSSVIRIVTLFYKFATVAGRYRYRLQYSIGTGIRYV